MTPSDPAHRRRPYVIAAVVPAYRVEPQIGGLLDSIPSYIRHIVVVDDASPDQTGEVVRRRASADRRIHLVTHDRNRGVGGAMVTGFRTALDLGADLVVKIDGDGQMPPAEIPRLLEPILGGRADFTKGNRFRDFAALRRMPLIRRLGNAVLSLLAKAATGYWGCFDPTNGFLAGTGEMLRRLPLEELDRGYFFEISLLGQLYLAGAVVRDVPMPARYAGEVSSLSITRVVVEFPLKLLRIFLRRLLLKHFVHEFSLAAVYLLGGVPLLLFGIVFGATNWIRYSQLGIPAPTGTVILATLPVILGFQLILSAVAIDSQSVPDDPLTSPLPMEGEARRGQKGGERARRPKRSGATNRRAARR